MKEIIFKKIGSADELQVVESAIPTPGKGEVVVKASAIAVNPVDNLILAGLYPGGEKSPHRLGTDASGVIHSVGEGVCDVKVGDNVWVYFPSYNGCGTYAEYFKCPSSCAHILPENVDIKAAAGLGIPFLTALMAIEAAHARPSETILVNGAGGAVGRAAIQLGRMIGMTVVGTAGNDEGLALIKKLGVHHAFNYKDAELKQKIMDCTGGKGVDVIIEPIGNVNMANDVEVAAQRGRIVTFGAKAPMANFSVLSLFSKEVSIQGLLVFAASECTVRQSIAYLQAGLRSGSLTPTVGCEYPLDKVKEAFTAMNSGAAKGKLLLIP